MPEEHPRPSSWMRLAAVVGSVIGITAAVNGAADRHLQRHSPNWSHRLVEAKFHMVTEASVPVDWLILGDSSAAHGFRPDVWMARTGEHAWNLATVAGLGVVGDAWALTDYVERVGMPGGVLLMHTADGWTREVSPALVGQVPRSLWAMAAWQPHLRWSLGAHWAHFLSRYVPLYAESGSLVSSLWGRALPPELQVRVGPSGWVPSRPADPAARERDAVDFLGRLRSVGPALSDESRSALQTIDDICRAADIPVVVVHAPVWSEVALNPAYGASLDAVDAALQDALPHASRSPVRFPDGVEADQLEATVDHLLPDGASTFTAAVAQAVLP